ncbi:hypothetical protein DFR69_103441 [Nocardia neocaledoniensis]|uniref:Uncharacterized protein n=1 Tax=Nocardia neocaledoniensis TaxID=236511 RepID=A0A317NR95_9NOCA|nr:hypothetical protein [Nocardia neocaledoniensis]PWV77841.1 hypothetical protein DFR69_103441 [Nocardia neocaledoniensis]
MAITAPVTCWACQTAAATTVFPELEPGPWKPCLVCQPCLEDYHESMRQLAEYH